MLLRTFDRVHVDDTVDGVDALVKALSGSFDAIIAADDLPGISGEDLCRVLRQDPWTREVPFILTSTAPPTPAMRTVVDVVLEAPVDTKVLFESLQQVLGPKTITSAIEDDASSTSPASRRHRRGRTMNPPLTPPRLPCPQCRRPLVYLYSQLGGVNDRLPEQWDYFECMNSCGSFQYRHRTRRTRQVGSSR